MKEKDCPRYTGDYGQCYEDLCSVGVKLRHKRYKEKDIKIIYPEWVNSA